MRRWTLNCLYTKYLSKISVLPFRFLYQRSIRKDISITGYYNRCSLIAKEIGLLDDLDIESRETTFSIVRSALFKSKYPCFFISPISSFYFYFAIHVMSTISIEEYSSLWNLARYHLGLTFTPISWDKDSRFMQRIWNINASVGTWTSGFPAKGYSFFFFK